MTITKLGWIKRDYYHDGLQRWVEILEKGGIGILSPAPDQHIPILVAVKGGILIPPNSCIRGSIEHAMLLGEYMLTVFPDWRGILSFSKKDKKKAAQCIQNIRDGGNLYFDLNGEKKTLSLFMESDQTEVTK